MKVNATTCLEIEIPSYDVTAQLAQSARAVEYTDCFSAEGYAPSNECPEYDTKQCEGEVPVMLELLLMQSTPLLPSFPGSLWTGVVALERALSTGQIELNSVLMLN